MSQSGPRNDDRILQRHRRERISDERCVPLRSTRRSSITSSSRRWMDVSPTPRPARCQNSRGQHGEDVVANNDALARQLHLGPPRGVGNRTGALWSGFMPTGSKHRVRFANKHLLLSRPLRGYAVEQPPSSIVSSCAGTAHADDEAERYPSAHTVQ